MGIGRIEGAQNPRKFDDIQPDFGIGKGQRDTVGRRARDGEGRFCQAVARPGGRIAGGTSQVQRNIIGERLLGLPREPKG